MEIGHRGPSQENPPHDGFVEDMGLPERRLIQWVLVSSSRRLCTDLESVGIVDCALVI